MLLLVTIGLVLVGAVSLVIGFVSNSLPPIYLSIACSVVAGIVLVVFSRMSKRQEAGGPSTSAFTPAPSPGTWMPTPSTPPPPAPSYQSPTSPARAGEAEAASSPARSAPAGATAVAVEDFPIDGYDTLRVSQILPALDELDLDALDVVREREEQGKSRTTVLRRIDLLMDELEAEDEAPEPEDEGGEGDVLDDDLVEDVEYEDDLEADDDAADDDDLAGVEVQEQDHTAVMEAVGSADASFPIPDYDRLPVA
ncbi:MAG: hypothetical protein ABIS21_05955, partial [Acidimicrobiales bacterium]